MIDPPRPLIGICAAADELRAVGVQWHPEAMDLSRTIGLFVAAAAPAGVR